MKDKLGIYHAEDDLSAEVEILDLYRLIQRIADTLATWDEESVAKIANKVLLEKVIWTTGFDGWKHFSLTKKK